MFIRRKEFDELKSSVKLYRDYSEDTLRKLNKVCELLKYKPEYVPNSYSFYRDSSPAQIDLGNNLIRKLHKKPATPESYEVEDNVIYKPVEASYSLTGKEACDSYKRAREKLKQTASEAMYNDNNPLWSLVSRKPRKKKKFNNKKNKEK